MADRLSRQQLERRVVDDLSLVHEAAVAVRCVLAQAHIGDYDEIRKRSLELANGRLHDTIGGDGCASGLVPLGRDSEQQDRADALLPSGCGLTRELGHRQAVHTRHGGDRRSARLRLRNEQRIDEIRGP